MDKDFIPFSRKINFGREDFYLLDPDQKNFVSCLTRRETVSKSELQALAEFMGADLQQQLDPDEVAF